MERKKIYKNAYLLERAIAIAVNAHLGQKDKGGEPYILHPLRVMLALEDEEDRMTAVLHDVVEDTEISLESLRDSGFSETVLCAVDALTKKPGESRMQAAERIKKNPVARRVKLADLADNMDLSRIPSPSEKDLARLRQYEEILAFLKSE
ncbi:HD domain-containing protein [Desulfococcaceae bacterium OttesenSCG-928-F15]|nr:HD domain-containing protein [Desulfococcaceae bacterium OttesenSCG-928-F15]